MKKIVIFVSICVLLTACAGTKSEPVAPTQTEIAENAKTSEVQTCNPHIDNCDCTKWPENECLLTHDLVMEQLKTGAQPDQVVNDRSETMLMKALYAASVKALIDAGADVNTKTESGVTPFMLEYDVEIVRALIAAGADVNAKDNEGYSILRHQKNLLGNEAIVQVLKEAGAKEYIY